MKLPALVLAVAAATLLMGHATPQEKPNPQPKERAEDSAKKIKELRKGRIDTLEKLVKATTAQWQLPGRGSQVTDHELLEAHVQLLQARLDAAEKESDRISIYKETIDMLTKLEECANAHLAAGRANNLPILKIKARRLEVEIQFEQAKSKEAKESK